MTPSGAHTLTYYADFEHFSVILRTYRKRQLPNYSNRYNKDTAILWIHLQHYHNLLHQHLPRYIHNFANHNFPVHILKVFEVFELVEFCVFSQVILVVVLEGFAVETFDLFAGVNISQKSRICIPEYFRKIRNFFGKVLGSHIQKIAIFEQKILISSFFLVQ